MSGTAPTRGPGESDDSPRRSCSTTCGAAGRPTAGARRAAGSTGRKLGFARLRGRRRRPSRRRATRSSSVSRVETSRRTASTPDEPVFRCQGTDWFDASQPVGWWNVRSFVREWTCGNVSFGQLSKKMTRVVFGEIAARLHLVERYRRMPHDPSSHPVETPPPRGLEPGTLVQIRSRRTRSRRLSTLTPRTRGWLRSERDGSRTAARRSRSREASSGSSTRRPESSFGSRATATSSTGSYARAIGATADGSASVRSTRGGGRRGFEPVGRAVARPGAPSRADRAPRPVVKRTAVSDGFVRPRQVRGARAGTPRTIAPGGTSRVTTAPAPTSAPAPTRTPPSTTAPDPIDAPRSTTVSRRSQSASRLKRAVRGRRSRVLVVDEHHAVPDEHLVLDRHTVADERMALDLAVRADHRTALNLDERADPRVVADPAPVEVRERLDDDLVAELDVVQDPVRSVVDRPVRHRRTRTRTPSTTCSTCVSVIPGKIGSERASFAIRSATGNEPSA